MEHYHKYCLNGTLKEMFSAMTPNFKAEFETYCNEPNSNRTLAFLSSTSCMNINLHKAHKCYEDSIKNLASIRLAPESKKVPYTCWYEKLKFIKICFKIVNSLVSSASL